MAEKGKDRGESKLARAGEGARSGSMARYEPRFGGPLGLMDWMFDRMQRDLFEPFFERGGLARAGGREMPLERLAQIDVHETDQDLIVAVELPGISPEDVQIECRDDVLTVRGERREERKEEGEQEVSYVSFHRQIRLPEDVDVDKGQASFKHGLLEIRFPRQSGQTQVRQIPISSERGTERAA